MLQTLLYMAVAILVGGFVYAIVVVFPLKLKMAQRIGRDKSFYDMKRLAKDGDADAIELLAKSNRVLWVVIPSSMLTSILLTLQRHASLAQ